MFCIKMECQAYELRVHNVAPTAGAACCSGVDGGPSGPWDGSAQGQRVSGEDWLTDLTTEHTLLLTAG